ncbi:PPE family protein PPE26 [Mycobacterium simulans]|uniref:PPE family protein n=1 Tax=Mycobacterium simulans TaxID=627089 RepID=UPI00174D7460|nr:PPE family protein [Mycobacterium simulans]SON63856.1 PPE family protein PPE26 [Mycobacterium simulans]
MDFGALPPEVNSLRMYSGPGSAPMSAAASAWNGLAAELDSAATGYETVITTLHCEEWVGLASSSMAAAVTPYVAWMRATAAQAEEAASKSRMAVAAYEAAVTAVVPPPLVTANRTQLVSLVKANTFGQYTASIAALEAQYGEMWAQDAMAMYSYAAASASASTVTPFAPPPDTTNAAAGALQAAAVTQAAATSAGTIQTTLAQLVSRAPSALLELTRPFMSLTTSAGVSATPQWLQYLETFLNVISPLTGTWYNTTGLPYFGIGIANSIASAERAMGMIGPDAAAPVAGAEVALGAGIPRADLPVAAGLGNAASIGKLSVPASWPAAGPALAPTVGSASAPLVSDVVVPEAGATGNLLGGMPLAGPGLGGAGSGPRYGFRPKVMMRPTFAG